MNTYFYAASTNAFYLASLKDDYVSNKSWPDDAIKVKDAIFNECQNPPEGKMRIAGEDGLPAWADIPPLPARDPNVEFDNIYQAREFIRAADSAMIKALSTAVFDVLKVDISEVQKNMTAAVSPLGLSKSNDSETLDIKKLISKRNRAEAFIQAGVNKGLTEPQPATA